MTFEEWIKVVAIVVTAFIAVCGWFVMHLHRLALDRRAARLDRINKQLRELYGPLYATLEASSETWGSFCRKYWPKHGETGYFAGGDATKLSEDEKRRWVTWMKNVFQPMNSQTAELIRKNVDLIEGTEIPKAFLDALAHISAYHAILAQWEAGDFSEYTSVNKWPYRELMAEVKPVFEKLRRDQLQLLGTNKT